MDLKQTLKYFRLNFTGTNLLVIAVAIVTVAILVMNYFPKQTPPNPLINKIGDEPVSQNVHIVGKGESLSLIAQKVYGDMAKWKNIADANGITNPNQIVEGQKLVLPEIPEATSRLSETPVPTVSEATPTVLLTPSDINNPANTSSTSTEAKTYTVKSGDNLWTIAETEYQSGYNWVDIAQANSLKSPGHIEEGQVIYIPNVNPKKLTVDSAEPSVNTEAISSDSYTVAKGDNLWEIAVRAYGDGYQWPKIAQANSLSNPGLIYSGTELKLPR